MTRQRWFAAFVLALAAASLVPRAQAANMVVVEARGIGLKPGQMLDADAPLLLKEGQHVSLIAIDGVTVKLDGPFQNSPASVASANHDAAGATALSFLTQAKTRTEGGFARAGSEVDLPDPWLLDVNRRGNVCLRQGERPVFWRESATTESKLSVVPGDRSWRAEATWPAGVDRMIVARDIPVRDGSTFIVAINQDALAITVRVVPAALSTDKMRVAWMAHQGCRLQAEALARTLPAG